MMTDSLGNNLDFQISTSKYVVLKWVSSRVLDLKCEEVFV